MGADRGQDRWVPGSAAPEYVLHLGAVPLATRPLALSPGVGHMPCANPALRESFVVTITQLGGDPFTPLETRLP